MSYWALIPFVSWLAVSAVWGLAFGAHRHSRAGRAFLALAGAMALWAFVDTLNGLPSLYGSEATIVGIAELIWIPIGLCFLNFVYELLGRAKDLLFWLLAGAALCAVALSLMSPVHPTEGFVRYPWGVVSARDPAVYTFFLLASFTAIFAGFGRLLQAARRSRNPATKKQLKSLVVAGSAVLSVGFVQYAIFATWLGRHDTPRFATLEMGAFVVAIYIALKKHTTLANPVQQIARDLFDSLRDGILLVDYRGRIKYMNRAMVSLAEHTASDRNSFNLEQLLPNGISALSAKETAITLTAPGGAKREFVVSLSELSETKILFGHLLILRDVTAEQRSHALLRLSRQELQDEVDRRTEEFFQVQKMSAIGKLAPGIVHDLNNLLTAIIGFSQAAQLGVAAAGPDATDDEFPIGEDLDEILQAAFRARDLVGHIPTYEQVATQAKVLVKPERAIGEAIKVFSVAHQGAGATEIATDICADPHYIMADPTKLQRMLLNLLVNAEQSLDDGGIITVTLSNQEIIGDAPLPVSSLTTGHYVRITVRDTGHGMDEDTVSHMFEPFFTTKEAGKGTGLGLAAVNKIIDEHDGAITVESNLGQGTAFSVYLPALSHQSDMLEEDAVTKSSGRERLWVVDDEEQVAQAVVRMLAPLGYQVTVFTSPAQALAELGTDPAALDLLITDESMPEMLGTQLAQKARDHRPDLPVIVVTGGRNLQELKHRMSALPSAQLIFKPMVREQLATAVRRLIDP